LDVRKNLSKKGACTELQITALADIKSSHYG